MRRTITSFLADDCPFYAGAVAYQLFFAIIPLLALIVGALAFLYGPERAQREIGDLIREAYPSATAQETRIARDLVNGRAVSLGFGIVGTLLSGMGIQGALDRALAAVLGQEGRRKFVRDRVAAAGFLASLLALAVVSFALSYGVTALAAGLSGTGVAGAAEAAIRAFSQLAGLLVGFAFFGLVYSQIPRRRVPARAVAEAALVSAVLWEIAKLAFGYFTRALGVFAAYGPLAFAAGLLTWIYLTAVIILVGAEVMKTRGAA